MSQKNKIAIVLPAYDPEETLLSFVSDLQKRLAGNMSIVIVNDGSAAGKAAVFSQLPQTSSLTVIDHPVNRGKGAALKTAFSYLLEKYENDPDFAGCVTADCDGQHSVDDVMQAAALLSDLKTEFILGCRCFSDCDVPWKSRFGNRCTGFVFKYLLRQPVSDTQTGLRGIPRDLMARCLQIKANRFEFETEMFFAAKGIGCKIHEYSIQTIYFNQNSGTHFHPLKDALRIYGVIFRFLFGEFFRFLLSGLSSALVDIGVFSLLYYVILPAGGMIKFADWQFDSRIFWACIIARMISSLWNFFINHTLIFNTAGKKNPLSLLGKYYLLVVVIMVGSLLLTDMCSNYISERFLAAAKVAVDTFLFMVSYFAQRYIVFRRKDVD